MRRNFHEVEKPTVMIIPMIDIMLFLLVFFMISTLYMVQLNTISVNLPAAAAVERETKPNIVSVTVTAKGDVYYDKSQDPETDLSGKVKASLAADPKTIFVIRGDKKTDYEAVTAVLDTLKNAGAHHVSLATESKSRS